MKSNLLSRILPPAGSPSVYEAIREHDADSNASDVEERAGLAWDEERVGGDHYNDRELEDAMADAQGSVLSSPTNSTTAFLAQDRSSKEGKGKGKGKATSRHRKPNRPLWVQDGIPEYNADEADEDVPASLLVEGNHDDDELRSRLPPPPRSHPHQQSPDPGPSSRSNIPRWETNREATKQLGLHDDLQNQRAPPAARWSIGQHPNLAFVDPKEKAMWRWANVENLDNFLEDVYAYSQGNGIWSISLQRAIGLLNFAFIVGFSTFLTNCVDYSNVRGSRTLDDILIKRCTTKMSTTSTLFLWILTCFWIERAFRYLLDIRRLKHMHDFYYYLLGISDDEIQTISWQEIVSRLMALRDANPATARVSTQHRKLMGSQSKQRMDAHDIANRLMRKENYLIALVNKDILDLSLPIPFLRNRQLFSKVLEWNIYLCIMDYLFNEQGQIKTLFLRDTHRKALAEGLRRRFIVIGILNIFVAPFLVVYYLMHHFFRYFNEYKKNPSQIGSRQYTPLAEWKFREFNELDHLFQSRTNMSYPYASRYIDQFPKDKTVQLAGFVAFISGAITSVLAVASLVDPELFLGFELTNDRTVLFYLGVFGSVWAVARGLAPEENDVFDPEYALLEVIRDTHYFPSHWKGRLHSDEVRKEFAMLYQMRIVIFLEEVLSIIFTPFILWFSLPKCSERIIDFFREFTVHVDGLGYLCSFAVFDFKKGTNEITQGAAGRHHRNAHDPARQDPRTDYFSTKDGKMLASYYGFLDNYGANPRPSGRRPFHPPPAFPTLGSPSGIDLGHYPYPRSGPAAGAPGSTMIGQMSTAGARFGAPGAMDHLSPAPSMLLDPHHQPSAMNRTSAHPTYRASRAVPRVAEPIEDEDEPPSTTTDAHRLAPLPAHTTTASSGGIGESESNLGDSWRMNLMGSGEGEEEGEEGENVDRIVEGPGVLGLIQQFQKANNDGRGRTTVGI